MGLNEREKNIASLITKLSEYANDESTTQGSINNILEAIKNETRENAKEQMEKVKSEAALASKQMVPPVQKQNIDMGFFRPDNVGVSMRKDYYKPTPSSIIFTRIRDVKTPGKAHPTDAGIDFYVPDENAWNQEFKDKVIDYSKNPPIPPDGSGSEFVKFLPEDETIGGEHIPTKICVMPGGHVAIPSGIKTIIPQGFGMMMVNKSGVATKMKLAHSACLIDSEYRDELIFCFFNHSTEPVVIEPGMKITQGLIVPIINFQLDEVVNRAYDDMGKESNRGGGFGSSGTY